MVENASQNICRMSAKVGAHATGSVVPQGHWARLRSRRMPPRQETTHTRIQLQPQIQVKPPEQEPIYRAFSVPHVLVQDQQFRYRQGQNPCNLQDSIEFLESPAEHETVGVLRVLVQKITQ